MTGGGSTVGAGSVSAPHDPSARSAAAAGAMSRRDEIMSPRTRLARRFQLGSAPHHVDHRMDVLL